MIIEIHHRCSDFNSFRAAKVKSLFNAENGCNWEKSVELPIENMSWQIGLIVGASGSGKTSIGNRIFERPVYDIYSGWDNDKPIVDCIAAEGDFNTVTGALSAVGLGDVPAWLRPFHVLSNGEKFRAGLARLVCERPSEVVVDEFTSVIDRQIAKVGAAAFQKTWRRGEGKIVLLSCHYDIIDWLQPDWAYDMNEARFYTRDCLRQRPPLELQIYKVRGSIFPRIFKQHYYLDLPAPIAAEYFVGFIGGEPVCHLAVSPLFTAGAYRATRLVVMPEWQGIGVGTKFLSAVCEYHLRGNGRCGKKLPVFFHTSHPQLCGALRHARKWVQTGARLYGENKVRSKSSLQKSAKKRGETPLKIPGMAAISGRYRLLNILEMLVVKILGDKTSPAYKEAEKVVNMLGVHLWGELSPHIDVAIAPLLTTKISDEELLLPHFGTLIFHPSPLPYGRGASSIKWAYKKGEPITAATWFWADSGYDTGDICEQEIVKIDYTVRPRDFYERDILPAMCRTLERCLKNLQIGIKREIPQINKYASFDRRI